MIRLPSSRISLTEADIDHHLQRILFNRTLLAADIPQPEISERHRDLYLPPDGLQMGDFLPPGSTSFCTLDPPANDDVGYDGSSSLARRNFSGHYRRMEPEEYCAPGQQCRQFFGRATISSQLLGFDPDPDPYEYGTDIDGDGRISARRRVEKIPWPSARTQISGASLSGKVARDVSSTNLEALDSILPGSAFSDIEMSVVSRFSNPSTRPRQPDRSLNPNLCPLPDLRSSTSGNQLDESVAGFPSQHVPLYRHAAVRKSSLLRFAQNAVSEQSPDESIVHEVRTDGAQERNCLPHHRREPTSYYYQSGSYSRKSSDVDSGTLISTDTYLSSHLPNLSLQEERGLPSNFDPPIYTRSATTAEKNRQRQLKSPVDTESSRQYSSSFGVESYPLESFSPPSPMSHYFPTSYVRTRLPGDPDAELEEEPASLFPGAPDNAAGTDPQRNIPGNSSAGMNGSGESSNTLSLDSISTSGMEQDATGPFTDRQFSSQPSIFAPSDMDMEMRRTTESGRSEDVIKQRLANLVAYYSNHLDSDDSETESETANQETTDEQTETSPQRNRRQGEAEPSSAIGIDPRTATEQGPSDLARRGVPTFPAEVSGQLTTPTHRARLPQHSPTSLQSNTGSQVQREIQVYDDRLPATIQPRTPAALSRSHVSHRHCRPCPYHGHGASHVTHLHPRHHPRPAVNGSPVPRAVRDQPAVPGPSQLRSNRTSPDGQGIGATSLDVGNDNSGGDTSEEARAVDETTMSIGMNHGLVEHNPALFNRWFESRFPDFAGRRTDH